jgi:hypothetical protein
MARPQRAKRSSIDVNAQCDDAASSVDETASTTAPSTSDPDHRLPLTPPVLPFRYFKLAIERLKAAGNLPHRIDRSAWSSKQFLASGTQIAPAFQFLRLTDDEGRPLETLVATIASFGTDEWRERLGQVLSAAYVDVLAIGIDKATPRDILLLFRRHYTMDAVTGRMAVSFFVHATRDAQIDVGPFLSTTTKPPPPKPRTTPEEFRTTMLERLPPFEDAWSDDLKLAWLTAFNELASANR